MTFSFYLLPVFYLIPVLLTTYPLFPPAEPLHNIIRFPSLLRILVFLIPSLLLPPISLIATCPTLLLAIRHLHTAPTQTSIHPLFHRLDVTLLFSLPLLSNLFSTTTPLFSRLCSFVFSLLSILSFLFSCHQRHLQTPNLSVPSLLLPPSHPPPDPLRPVPPIASNASALTLLSFNWMTKTVSTGRVRPLQSADVPPLADRFRTDCTGRNTLQPIWKSEQQHGTGNLLKAMFRSFGVRFVLAGGLKALNDCCKFVSPVLLRLIILHLQKRREGEVAPMKGLGLAFALYTTYSCESLLFNQYFNFLTSVQVQVRGALVNAVFEKSCKLSPESRGLYTSGQIQNLMSTDSRAVSDVVLYLHMLWSSFEQIFVAIFLLVNLMGWFPTIAGLVFIIACMPIQGVLVSAIKSLREMASYRTDERVKQVAEAITGIKLVKLYAWELSFVRTILSARAKELKYLRKMALTQAWNSTITTSLPTMLTIVVFTAYVTLGHALDASVVFPAIALFNVIRPPLLFFPNILVSAARAAASLSRLEKFLKTGEVTPINEGPHALDLDEMEATRTDLAAENAAFTWDPSISLRAPTLSAVSFRIPEGSLVAVVGPTGQGKSSLLAGLLGEVPIISGKAGIRKGCSVSFCDQVPFIQNATLRDNILFGKPFDEKHYRDTVRVCCLLSDFKLLSAGDLTEIGGRGVNLSGGQRARVSLARAVYSRSDICLLDDPLCAVDAHVGKLIFNDCIVSMLRNKTRLLTTNQIHFAASPEVDMVIVVSHGTVLEFGTRRDLLANPDSEFARLVEAAGEMGSGEVPEAVVEKFEEDVAINTNDTVHRSIPIVNKIPAAASGETSSKTEGALLLDADGIANYGTIESGKLTRKERKEEGRVQFRHYIAYLKAMGIQWVLPISVLALSAQTCSLAVNLWLSRWSEEDAAATGADNATFNLVVFYILGSLAVAVASGSAFALAFGMTRASVLLHEKLLLSVFGAPSSFFNSTPLGRLINRFNSDMDKVDSTLGQNLQSLQRLVLSLSFTLGLILWTTPMFIFVVIPVAAICLYIQEFYRKSSVDIRRLEALARSPLYSHFGETLDGVVTIRAYGDLPRATHANDNYIDELNKTTFASSGANRWISVRLEALGTILIFGATILALFSPPGRISASMTGLVLSYVMQILGSMTWSVRQFTESESQLSAVERISEYSEAPFAQEEKGGLEGFLKEREEQETSSPSSISMSSSEGLISAQKLQQLTRGVGQGKSRWPKKGNIVFENVEMRYRGDLPPALRSVSFSIQPGEHVGVVGRTGAGKSSAIQSLFRLYELSNGRILIDNTDISKLRLFDLRSSLGIIPQEPFCFCGTIRSNLDMFGEHDDSNIEAALIACGLQDTMSQKVGLDFEIGEGGSNLSVGQRQLLCLGRALLRDSQILVLDEATSSVSNATDQKIQETLREEMAHCTILTVAHRLHTVMQSDRIIVMDKGKIGEIGIPSVLLKDRESMLSKLVDETGPGTAGHLRYLASLPRQMGHGSGGWDNNNVKQASIENAKIEKVENKGEGMFGRVRGAFLEMRGALMEARRMNRENEEGAGEWRDQLRLMVEKLNVLSEDIGAVELNGGGVYVEEVSNRSSDMIGEVVQGGVVAAGGMPNREKRDSDEELKMMQMGIGKGK